MSTPHFCQLIRIPGTKFIKTLKLAGGVSRLQTPKNLKASNDRERKLAMLVQIGPRSG